MDEAFVPAHDGGKAFAKTERAGCTNLESVLLRFDLCVFGSRTKCPRVSNGVQARDAGGKLEPGGRGFNRNIRLVARHVPVELVVIIEKPQGIKHAIVQDDSTR